MTDPKIDRARDAYRAYGQTTDFKNYQGLPMPEWDALPEKIREAWVNASNAAARYHEPVAYLVDDNTDYIPKISDDASESIARLRATAARLEDGECVSFALVTVPEDDVPFYSYRISGMEIAQMHRAAGEVCIGLEEVRAHLVKVAAVARLQWRHGEAAAKGLPITTPSQDKAG